MFASFFKGPSLCNQTTLSVSVTSPLSHQQQTIAIRLRPPPQGTVSVMVHSRFTTMLPKHDATGLGERTGGLRSRPSLLIKTTDLQFKTGDENSELDIIESYGLDSDRESIFTLTNSIPPRHLQYSSRASSCSAGSSAAAVVVSPLDSGLGTAANSSRSSIIPTPASTVPPTPVNTSPPSEYVNQSLVLSQEYTEIWLDSQLAKAEQGLCGLRTELMFYYQRKIIKADTVQSMKEVYEDRREGHTRAIAEYMTTGAVEPMSVQDTTTATQSGPQGVGAEMEGEGIGHDEVGEVEQVKRVEEVEQIDEAKTDKIVGRTDKAIEQTDKVAKETDKAVAQNDKTTEQTYNSRPGEIDKQMAPYASSPPTISIIEATPTLIRAPLFLSHPYIRRRKSPPPPPPIDETELPPVPPLKSVLRQLTFPVDAVPPQVANYHSKERSLAPPVMAAPGLDTEASIVSPAPPRGLLPGTESPPVPLIQSVQKKLRDPDTETTSFDTSLSPNRLPEIESPPMPPVQSVQQQPPTVPPRQAFICEENRNFTSPAMLQFPPGPVSDTEKIIVGLPALPTPTVEPLPAPQVKPVQLPIVPPRPAFIRGKIRNFTAPGPVAETSTVSPPLPPLPEPLPVPPLCDSLVLAQQQLPTAVPPIARPATRAEKRSFTAPGPLGSSPGTATATLTSTTVQRRPFPLPWVASSRAGSPAPAVPMTADESRRKVPTRSNNFSALLETFSQRPAPVTKQPNSKP